MVGGRDFDGAKVGKFGEAIMWGGCYGKCGS